MLRVTFIRVGSPDTRIIRDVLGFEDMPAKRGGRQLRAKFPDDAQEIIAFLADVDAGWSPVLDGAAVKGSWDYAVEHVG